MSPLFLDGGVPRARLATVTASISLTTPYIFDPSGTSLSVPSPAASDTLVVLNAAQSLSSKTLLQPVITSGVLTQPNITGGTLSGMSASMTTPVITSGSLTQPVITSGKLTSPTITQGGSWASALLTQPVVTSGYLSSPIIYGGTMTGATLASCTITTCTLSSPTIVMTGGQLSGGILYNVVFGARAITTIPTPARSIDFATANVFLDQVDAAHTLTVANASTGQQIVIKFLQTGASFWAVSWMTSFICAGASAITQTTNAMDVWTVMYDGLNMIAVGKQQNLA